MFLALQHSTDEKKLFFPSEFISKWLLQIPVIISDKTIFASSLKMLLILLKNFISHKTSQQLTSQYNLLLNISSLETDMRSTVYFKYLLFILVLLMN